ncbi:Conserved_hypothetical protein [Hexamita inflata]|uniref:Uncharacterized protein n=1 Tax=Hexamita inflata TaxID=28002 RepID=A0AA86NSF6_9EUKA|nr:Conserved hypothetical protein [Hexamita inflata]
MIYYSLCLTLVQQTINVSDCYQNQSKLTLDQTQQAFTLQIIPTNKSACQIFSGDVQINLTIGSSIFSDDLITMATDFVYNKVQYINFWLPFPCDLTNYKDEHVAFAKIFIVGFQTFAPIIIFDELKSDVVHSFSMLYLSFQNNSISFAMCPGYSSVSLFQETDLEIQDILFIVDRYQFKIDAPLFVDNYKQWLCFLQYFNTSDIQLQKILGVSFLRAKLIVISKINIRKTVMYFNVDINATDTKYVFKDQYIHLYQNNISYGRWNCFFLFTM